MRWKYAAATIACVVLGLCSRFYAASLPKLISDHAGDMLWASMVYFGLRFVWMNQRRSWAFTAGLLFSFSIEFSQLYQEDWIVGIRQTTLGVLILGRGFLWMDLARYTVGVGLAFVLDRYGLSKQEKI
ncbi:ribosomal maturation YjgA family protein [Paenibacillus hexagrammi]|uniref:DUF2809 domain-containing protein n=1 Tax=Paenibacillus hexagrammi TaxID=2908839 RepID=A0ABY3SFI0_9BACL|nr:DUF2809 domain-containing protein [Paenibacillus sp. YPD9-1]UJF32567.1 DUF2809 domain-containing protein [Paenibacillus sp. YPD9-1]